MMKLALFFVASLPLCQSAIEADLVPTLPGYADGDLKSKHYSGYLPVGATSGAGLGMLHYWLIESESETASTDPLVMWLNGGPGSSSLIGLLNENGQIKVNDDSLEVPDGDTPASFYNSYSWSQSANVLYLEQPKGVGYSFCLDGSSDCKNTDDNVGPDVHDFLVGFFEGFPEYADRDFWITGESYAGTYIPLIMDTISQQGVIMNLVGAAIGNGCTQGSCFSDMSSEYADFKMFAGHSLISNSLTDTINAECGDWTNGTDGKSDACVDAVAQMKGQAGSYNVYYMYDDCETDFASAIGGGGGGDLTAAIRRAQALGGNGKGIGFEESLTQNPPVWATLRDDLPRSSAASSSSPLAAAAATGAATGAASDGGGRRRKLSEDGGGGGTAWDGVSYPCGNNAALSAFLKDESVMEALHVNETLLSGQSYHSTAPDLRPLYKELAAKYKLVIFSGDSDMCVPYSYSSWWTQGLGFAVASDWHAWMSESLHGPATTLGGYAIEYDVPDADHSMYFVTVKGSGHMVPQYKPGFALTFFNNVLNFEF